MKRFASFIALIVLILLVIFSYFYYIEPTYLQIFQKYNSVTSLEFLEMGSEIIAVEHNPILYTSWVFIGIAILIFLKITWKLIVYNWAWNRLEEEKYTEKRYKPSS